MEVALLCPEVDPQTVGAEVADAGHPAVVRPAQQRDDPREHLFGTARRVDDGVDAHPTELHAARGPRPGHHDQWRKRDRTDRLD